MDCVFPDRSSHVYSFRVARQNAALVMARSRCSFAVSGSGGSVPAWMFQAVVRWRIALMWWYAGSASRSLVAHSPGPDLLLPVALPGPGAIAVSTAILAIWATSSVVIIGSMCVLVDVFKFDAFVGFDFASTYCCDVLIVPTYCSSCGTC